MQGPQVQTHDGDSCLSSPEASSSYSVSIGEGPQPHIPSSPSTQFTAPANHRSRWTKRNVHINLFTNQQALPESLLCVKPFPSGDTVVELSLDHGGLPHFSKTGSRKQNSQTTEQESRDSSKWQESGYERKSGRGFNTGTSHIISPFFPPRNPPTQRKQQGSGLVEKVLVSGD